MSVYFIASYDIEDPEVYEGYVPGVRPLLQKHGAEVLVADYEAKTIEGQGRGVQALRRLILLSECDSPKQNRYLKLYNRF